MTNKSRHPFPKRVSVFLDLPRGYFAQRLLLGQGKPLCMTALSLPLSQGFFYVS